MQVPTEPTTEIHVPRMKPVAPDTWEIRDVLLNTALQGSRIAIEFPGPSIVVGCRTIVRPDAAIGGLIMPTNEDILCLLDLDNQRRFTSSQGMTTGAGLDASFVTLSALDTEFRDLQLNLASPRPVLGVIFRWRPTTPALFVSCNISIAFYVITERS